MSNSSNSPSPVLLAIESSCDDTSAAVMHGQIVLSNITANQSIHEKFGGVVPELASRAHQANIVPVVSQALEMANVKLTDLHAIAFTQGPGLMGSLHVGVAFAKSMSLSLGIPMIAVNHMRAHILAHFIKQNVESAVPEFPLLCLTVSGGHTQLVLVISPSDMQIVGETIDDAAGEAFDKAAKVLGLPYPGGPLVDSRAALGDATKFTFTTPRIANFNYSFSGLKTNLLYFLRERNNEDATFIEREMNHICASYQRTIVSYLLAKMEAAAKHYGVKNVCLAGGVSANSELRSSFAMMALKNDWNAFIPPISYCTDNAAMVGITGYFSYLEESFSSMSVTPMPRIAWGK